MIAPRAFLLAGLLAAVGPAGCGEPPPLAVADRPRAGGTDVTFFVAADTHLGATPAIEALNRTQVQAMNALPGTPYPPPIGGGAVARPWAVLVAGDLTDHGLPGEWRQFAALYGRDGTDGLLRYPTEECTGNHDWLGWLGPLGAEVRARHGGRLIRSWDWSDVHVACLDVYPNDEALAWLRRDLAACGRQRPVVLYFHYGLAGPLSDWWPPAQKQAFARVIEGYNVVGIFHGHFHSTGHYRWNAWDAHLVGSPRHSAHTFVVVHITDTTLTAAAWDWDSKGWAWWERKAINGEETATSNSEH